MAHCRICKKSALEIGGYLHRVNEKGVAGVWECRPSCDAKLSNEDAILAAIEGPPDAEQKEFDKHDWKSDIERDDNP